MVKHLVIASFDGVATHYCGVGTVVRNMIKVLNEIAGPARVRISLAYISADPEGKVFDPACYQESKSLVEKTGGRLMPLSNGSPGFDEGDMWRSFPEWRQACASLTSALDHVLKHDEDNIVIVHGTPFLSFSRFKGQISGRKLRTFYFLHSTGLSHTFGDSDWRRERIQLENECFLLIRQDSDSRVIAVGETFAGHLRNDYGIEMPENAVVRNGLCFAHYDGDMGRGFGNSDLRRFGINLGDSSRIIFSWGRSSVVKGFKEMLEAWKAVQPELPNHYLVLQAPNNSGEDEYSQIVKNLAASIPRTILINEFDPSVWRTVLRCTGTDIVCIPSLRDTNPEIAIEAKLFSHGMNFVIIASNRDGVKDSFRDGECLWVDPSDVDGFSRNILAASKTGLIEREQMSGRNRESLARFDYSANFGKFLEDFDCL